MFNLKFIITICVYLIGIKCLFAQSAFAVLHSNSRSIKLIDDGIIKDWRIEPSLHLDSYRVYSSTQKKRKIKFVSDIDSIEFNVKVNHPVNFTIIVKNKDTAYTRINFTNSFETTLTKEDKLFAFSYFWSELKYNFAFIDKIKFNIDSLYKAYIPKVESTKNDFDFYDVMKLFASSFKDAHTNIAYNNSAPYVDYMGLLVRYFGNDLYVINVRSDLAQTYPLGSMILKINGLPVNQYMKDSIEPYVDSDFLPTVKYLSAQKLFAARPQKDLITITYQTPEGKIFTNTPPRDGKKKEFLQNIGVLPKYSSNLIDLSWEQGNIAVLGINTFINHQNKLINQFEKIKDTLYSAKGIIIDLRKNQGGMTDAAWHILQYIIKDKYFLNFAWQTRISNGVKRANGNYVTENEDFLKDRAFQTFKADTIYIPDSIKRFTAPIVILTSERTCSAAEDFLIILKERKDRPLFIGQPSFGSTGSPLVLWDFPTNGLARICSRRVLFPYSMTPFTEGITPDILVDYTLEEFMDPKLDKEVAVAVKEFCKTANRVLQ